MTIKELRAKRAAKLAEIKILATKEEKGEALADNERARFDEIETEIRGLDEQLTRAERIAEMERQAPAAPIGENRDAGPDLTRYSVRRALLGFEREQLNGLEAEVHQELSQGRKTVRGLMIPSEIILGERRDGQAVNPNTAGGFLVATQLAAVADRFRPSLRVESMGATVLRNLRGFLDLPNIAASGSAQWVSETEAPTRTDMDFEKVSMSPNCVAAEYAITRRLLINSSPAIEDLMRRDLGFLLAQALDAAAIKKRAATTAEPQGILDRSIEKVTTETLLSDTTANLLAALEMDDVMGTGAFLTSPKVMQGVRKVKDTTNRIIPASDIFHQSRVENTTQVPDNIGSGSNKSALIYGLWSELFIGYWSGIDIMPNPYHPDVASKGGLLMHAFLDADIALRHTKAFAYAEI